MLWMTMFLGCVGISAQNFQNQESMEANAMIDPTQQLYEGLEIAIASNEQPFAVFDADNTIWKYDIEEGLLAWMSANGQISMEKIPAHLFPITPNTDATPYSYYEQLSAIDHSLGYLWAAQVFSGFTLGELRKHVQDMMSSSEAMIVQLPNQESTEVQIPKIYPKQQELIRYLQENGVAVWVVSASLEEVVRMVVSDPQYGLNIPPEQVIGVNLMLHKPNGEATVGALERRAGKKGLEYYFSEERMSWKMGDYPFAPMTWYAGKVAAIKEWIHPSRRPILVAGDSPNDFYMQFYSDAIRLRIHRKDSHKAQLEERKNVWLEGSADENIAANWIEFTAEELGVSN